MTKRIPNIDWQLPFKRHWNDNNPPAGHAFNTLLFLFPEGEEFFMGSALEVAESFDFSQHQKLRKEAALFAAQEAIHSQQHSNITRY